VLARGQCSSGWTLPARLWYLPLLGAAVGSTTAVHSADARHAVLIGVFGAVLLALTGTCYETQLLPNRILYPAIGAAVALCWAWPERSALESLAGGGVAFLAFSLLCLLSPGVGFGNAKLALLMGLIVGLARVLPAMLIAVTAGGIAATLLIVFRRQRQGVTMAYGPYLALGAFVGMVCS
jgi:leader peptidase (prepilin peptidase)/N-methyltransferase